MHVRRHRIEPTAVESFELQRRPDVTGPVVDALLRGSNVTGLTAAVTGMSGVGKSSAAVLVMNEVWDPSGALRSRFDNAKMILLGPSKESVRAGLVELMRFLTKREDVGSIGLGAASAGQRILVVLDDACRADDVQPFRAINEECAILITTRNRDVIEAVQGAAIDVSLLSEDESAHWFTYYSGMTAALERARDAQRNRIGELVKRIAVGHCGRLPLAVRMVAAGVRRAAGGPSANLAQMAAQLSLELRELDKHGGDAHVPVQDDDEVVGGDAGWWRTMFNTLRLAVARAVADSPDREFGRMAHEVGLFAADADVPLRHLRFVWGVENVQRDTPRVGHRARHGRMRRARIRRRCLLRRRRAVLPHSLCCRAPRVRRRQCARRLLPLRGPSVCPRRVGVDKLVAVDVARGCPRRICGSA